MRFCDECGSRMNILKKGFLCPKCGHSVQTTKGIVEVKKLKYSEPIYVVDDSAKHYTKVNRICPRCGNGKAFHWFSWISGEHAGVTQERTVEHFKCTKCLHIWGVSK